MTRKRILEPLSADQLTLKNLQDQQLAAVQLLGVLVNRLIQRNGSVNDLKLLLGGLNGTEYADDMLNAIARTEHHHLNVDRLYGYEVIARECPILYDQERVREETIKELDRQDWFKHLAGRHAFLQCLTVSFGHETNMHDIVRYGIDMIDSNRAPRGYRLANTAELFSFHAGSEPLLPYLVGKRVLALGDADLSPGQPFCKVGSLSYPPIKRDRGVAVSHPTYAKVRMSPASQLNDPDKRIVILYVAEH